jgi:hypothetical protein
MPYSLPNHHEDEDVMRAAMRHIETTVDVPAGFDERNRHEDGGAQGGQFEDVEDDMER